MWGAIAVAAFVSAAALLVFGSASPLYPGRLSLFDDNPIWTARAVFIGALVATFGPFPRGARLIMVPVLVLAGIVTVSLGPLLGFAAGVWAGIAETLRSADRRTDRLGLGWVVLGLVSGLALVVLLADAFFGGDASILARVLVNDPNVSGRATFLDAAIRLFSGSPFLGVGIGGFTSTGLIEYPHNLVAEVGSELGGIGLIVLAVWTAVALRGAARSPVLVALLVATAVYALFSGSVASNGEFWMISALCVANIAVPSRAKASVLEATSVAASRRSAALAGAAPARRA
jgi:O-antigen ligase